MKFQAMGLFLAAFSLLSCLSSNEGGGTGDIKDTTLIAYWDFNDGSGTILTDLSEKRNHGIIIGAVWAAGIQGTGLHFNYNNVIDRVDIRNPHDLNLSGQSLTISTWVRFDSLVSRHEIFSTERSPWDGYLLSYHDDSIQLALIGGVGNLYAGVPDIGRWNHIAGTYDGNQLKLYRNGVLIGTSNSTNAILPNSVIPTIGNNPGAGGSGRMNGSIDELRIYKRVWSTSEVLSEWNKYKDYINN